VKRISNALLAVLFMVAGSAQAAETTGFYAGGGIGWNTLETDQDTNLLAGSATNQACLNGTITGYINDPAPGACYTYFDNGSTFNETAFGFDGFVGYQFTSALSAELQYVWFGNASRVDDVLFSAPQGGAFAIPPSYQKNDQLNYEQEATIRAFNVAGRYSFMFSEKWGLNLMGGWTFAKSKYSQFADNIQQVNTGATWYRPPTEVKRSLNDNGFLVGLGAVINTTENTFLRIEYTYYGIDFDNSFENPTRLGADVGYRF